MIYLEVIVISKTVQIKQKILTLDGGTFQNLCNDYLSRIGYKDIVALGSEAGTQKTTKGTPDAYFKTKDDKFIFVEYTTQKSLTKKLKKDIDNCLKESKTKLPTNQISEIIYCHTCSNVPPNIDNEVRLICDDKGIKLNLIGIDKLVHEICTTYPTLAKDYLGVSIDTGQIQKINDFVKDYNKNKMAAPIDTNFLFREQELETINKEFSNCDIVIISGVAGVGKTRLALQYAENHIIVNNSQLYCISNKSLSIYEDLKDYIGMKGKYFLIIDDANQLSELRQVIELVKRNSDDFNLKILITVRDYAKDKVESEIFEIAEYKLLRIDKFNDKEIVKLLESSLNILNSKYQQQIIRIAEGNARISIIAGEIACEKETLESISNATELYDCYYRNFLSEYFDNNKHLLKTAGIIAFVNKINLVKNDNLTFLLTENGLNYETFIDNIDKLHQLEIVDKYSNEVARISEQCFANYLLKYVFFDKKLLSLSTMIKNCFIICKDSTINSIQTMINIFQIKEMYKFVEDEVRKVWDNLDNNEDVHFFEFVKVFYSFNRLKTLQLLYKKIEYKENVSIKITDLDTQKGKTNNNVSDDIIRILGGFSNTEEFKTSLELFFKYYFKRPDLYIQFYHGTCNSFGVNENSIKFDFKTQITFFEQMKDFSNNQPNSEFIIALFLDLSSNFLNLTFTPTELGRNHTLNFYTINLEPTDGCKEYRKIIWEWLLDLSNNNLYIEQIRNILNSYGLFNKVATNKLALYDYTYIKRIMEKSFPKNDIKNSFLAEHLDKVFDFDDASNQFFKDYLSHDVYQVYSLLNGFNIEKNDLEEHQIKHRASIENYLKDFDFKFMKNLIDIYFEIQSLNKTGSLFINSGFKFAFDYIFKNHKIYYAKSVKHLMNYDTTNISNRCEFINNLFSLLTDKEVYELASSCEGVQKNIWLYAYFHEIPKEDITNEHINMLYMFLKDTSDKETTSSTSRNINFLEKYTELDNDVFINACTIILNKREYSHFIVSKYFSSLFDDCDDNPKEVIDKFKGNINLLADIYVQELNFNGNSVDYDGMFLIEIYKYHPSILDEFLVYLSNPENYDLNNTEKINCFFSQPNYIEIYDKIFDALVQKNNTSYLIPIPILNKIIRNNKPENQEKIDIWIKHNINNYFNENDKMYSLFSEICTLDNQKRIEYIKLFYKNNNSLESFKILPLTPRSTGMVNGSFIPIYRKRIKFLEELRGYFDDLRGLEYRIVIDKQINFLEESIKSEEKEEFLND